MNNLTHVAIAKGYLLLYLLLYYKADFADADPLRIQSGSNGASTNESPPRAASSRIYATENTWPQMVYRTPRSLILPDNWWNSNNRRLLQRLSMGHAPRCNIGREAIG